jgi:nitrate/TMAO reductase-like tetraheme cytochrome c subunit
MKRWVKRALFFGGLAFAIGWLLFVGAKVTDRPSFCGSCHIMEPYYENWAGSSHTHVSCITCHYKRGFWGYLEGKFALMGEAIRYATGTYNTPLRAEVSDRACLECHEEQTLKEALTFQRKIHFSHQDHYPAQARGIELSCTSCHSELVQGSHMAATQETCVLCHFVGMPHEEPLAGCESCHGPPKDNILIGGLVFSHSKYLKSGVECLVCHVHVTRGRGDVPREKCYSCHVERFEEYGKTQVVHRVHVAQHKLECRDCHTALEHGQFELAQALVPGCATCHGGRHSLQEGVYIGTGGRGVEPIPDPMFLSGVACFGCHRAKPVRDPSGQISIVLETDPEACVSCHGPGFDELMLRWQASIKKYLSELKERLTRLEERLDGLDSASPQAEGLYELARQNIELVERDGSLGVHNIHYVNELLQRSERALIEAEAILAGSEPAFEPIPTSKFDCTRCHVGIERSLMASEVQTASHKLHLARYDCDVCHGVRPGEHGTTSPGAKDCTACHPKAEQLAEMSGRDCLKCHEAEVEVPSELVRFPHAGHVDYGCGFCHLRVVRMDHLKFLQSQPEVRFDHRGCSRCHASEVPPDGTDCAKCHLKF